jgi:hypothetical protein
MKDNLNAKLVFVLSSYELFERIVICLSINRVYLYLFQTHGQFDNFTVNEHVYSISCSTEQLWCLVVK